MVELHTLAPLHPGFETTTGKMLAFLYLRGDFST